MRGSLGMDEGCWWSKNTQKRKISKIFDKCLMLYQKKSLICNDPAWKINTRIRKIDWQKTHVLQNPTDSTELDSSSSLALSQENDPITCKRPTESSETLFNTVSCVLPGLSGSHLACGGVDEPGVTVYWACQHQWTVLVGRQAGQRPLVSVLTCWRVEKWQMCPNTVASLCFSCAA